MTEHGYALWVLAKVLARIVGICLMAWVVWHLAPWLLRGGR